MALIRGIRYAMSDANAQSLARWRPIQVGRCPILLELNDGAEVVATDLESFEPGGDFVLSIAEEERRIHWDEVNGFTLLDPDPPLDQSDEVGRS
jgi:hypothetical protein